MSRERWVKTTWMLPGLVLGAAGLAQAQFNEEGVRYIAPDGPANGGSAAAIALQPGGRMIIAGTTRLAADPNAVTLRVRRLEPDGRDAEFGGFSLGHSGSLSIPRRGLLVDDGGAVFLAYNLADANTPSDERGRIIVRGEPASGVDFQDYTFEVGNGSDVIQAIALDQDRRLVVAASTPSLAVSGRTALLFRLNTDGSVDGSFGDSGFTSVAPRSSRTFFQRFYDSISLTSVLLFSDGRVAAVGTAQNSTSNESEMLIVRLLPNGDLDPDFNNGEPLLFAHRSGSQVSSFTSAVAADMAPDGTLVVAGRAAFGSDSACFWQFSPAGERQASQCDDFDIADSSSDVLLLPSGGVLGIGRFLDGGTFRSTVAFYLDGLPFSGDNVDRFGSSPRYHLLSAVAYNPDRRELITVGGGATIESGILAERWVVTRNAVAGNLDLDPDSFDTGEPQTVAPGSVVSSPTGSFTGVDPTLRIPMRLTGGSAIIDGIRFEAGAATRLFYLSLDAFTAALPIRLEHVAGGQNGDLRDTTTRIGGHVRANNLVLQVGSTRFNLLRSVVGTPPVPLLVDGFEDP
jgi:uncharacterized delta-60 repeat protein